MTTIKDAIKSFEDQKQVVASEATKVELQGKCPPIEKIDNSLSTLKSCTHLSLSSNNIDKIANINGLENLKILSIGRNLIKKIENLDSVSNTLEELWLSYNQIEKLSGIEKLINLKVLYISNNKIREISEIEKLSILTHLEDLLLIGNPIQLEYKENGTLNDYRIEIIKRIPQLKKLDGQLIDIDERELAKTTTTT